MYSTKMGLKKSVRPRKKTWFDRNIHRANRRDLLDVPE